MKHQRCVALIVSLMLVICCVPPSGEAKLSEPMNIIYGFAGPAVHTVRLVIDDSELVSYPMGSDPNVGTFTYVLRIPLDTLDPARSDCARIGDRARVFINENVIPEFGVRIRERGSVFFLNLGAPPEISVTVDTTEIPHETGTYAYGSVPLGSSTSVSLTITNTSDEVPLELTGDSPVMISGEHASDFSVLLPQPSSPVEPEASVSFTIEFTPLAEGTRTATVSIANTDIDEDPYTFSLTGIGTGQAQDPNSFILWTK